MPLVTFVGVTLNIIPLQVVVVIGVIVALGLTVTVTVNVDAAPQAAVEGVTIYVAVTAKIVVLFSKPFTLLTPTI
jgi:hypothetical protein